MAQGVPEVIGETSDHVHLPVGIRATHRLADVMRDIKQASSKMGSRNDRIEEFRMAGWIRRVHHRRIANRSG